MRPADGSEGCGLTVDDTKAVIRMHGTVNVFIQSGILLLFAANTCQVWVPFSVSIYSFIYVMRSCNKVVFTSYG